MVPVLCSSQGGRISRFVNLKTLPMQELIVIITDPPNELAMLNNALQNLGIDNICTKTYNPDRAFSLLQNALPDVILLDMEMQSVNYLNYLQAIKRIEKIPDVPVVIYGDHISNGGKKRMLISGALFCDATISSTKGLAKCIADILSDKHLVRRWYNIINDQAAMENE